MSDPTRIRSIAVHREDVATALEATIRSERRVVLRITPPFSGRMRARLHELSSGRADEKDEDGKDEPIHVDPHDLIDDVPAYPEVDQTASEYPEANLETRRKRHMEAVDSWREVIRDSVTDSVTIDAGSVAREVDVVALG